MTLSFSDELKNLDGTDAASTSRSWQCEVVRHLPAERDIAAGLSGRATEAFLSLGLDQSRSIRRTAASLDTGVGSFILAAFASLLARLTAQEVISIRCAATSPAVMSFLFEADGRFRDAVRHAASDAGLMPVGLNEPGVSYQFVRLKEPAEFGDVRVLHLLVREEATNIRIALSSPVGRWSERTLESWLSSLNTLVGAVTADPRIRVSGLPVLGERKILEFYDELNRTAADFPADLCGHQLIEHQARKTPNAVAVADASKQYTYGELDARSSALALHLRRLGAGPGRPVAVCMERTAEMPMALLAVLKAGSCYVPLDSHNPRQRLLDIFEECKPVAILSDGAVSAFLAVDSIPVVCVDAPLPEVDERIPAGAAAGPRDLAYIIYTSGTTGKPKGVMIQHRSLVNLLWAMERKPGFSASDRLLALATISFDIATMEMFLPLCTGGTLVVGDRHLAGDPARLSSMLEKFRITVLQATPVTWRLLAAWGWQGKSDLKIICGGEALPRDLADLLLPRCGELWNAYGPTETTIWSSMLRVEAGTGSVPVGPPIANTSFYVMDDAGRPLPAGFPGELYIGGAGVSVGYLERPELTAERFVADRFAMDSGARMFRTGDLVRILDRGAIEFFGRLDHQVKLRGYRIELEEIETVFRTHPLVENAAVTLRDDAAGEPQLVAYLTSRSEDLQAQQLKEYAAGTLPDYMLPAQIVFLDAFPLTASGKIARNALPAPESVSGRSKKPAVPDAGAEPASEAEAKLLKIFRDVLGNDSIGVTDSFFDYGGYSLLAVRLFGRIRRGMGVNLPISVLFDAPTVRELAQVLVKSDSLPIMVPIRPQGRAAPLFVIHSYLLYGVLPQAVEEDRPIYGLRELFNHDSALTAEQRAAIYAREIVRVYPNGPLYLAGWCAAGSLTVEIARQLRRMGHEVGLVALFDAERPGYRPQFGGQGSLWRAKIAGAWRFHTQRLREASWSERLLYLPEALRRQWDNQMESLYTRHQASLLRLQKHFGFLLPESLFRNGWVNLAAIQTRSTQPYPGEIVLFRAMDIPQVEGMDQDLGWRDIAADGVVVVYVPGNHESMFQKPNLASLSRMLQAAMQGRKENMLKVQPGEQVRA